MVPAVMITATFVAAARQFVYDIDDMVFLGHSSEATRFIQALKGRKKMIFLMRKADHVVVCCLHPLVVATLTVGLFLRGEAMFS
jgi:hypothetical protein